VFPYSYSESWSRTLVRKVGTQLPEYTVLYKPAGYIVHLSNNSFAFWNMFHLSSAVDFVVRLSSFLFSVQVMRGGGGGGGGKWVELSKYRARVEVASILVG
jgi:hypothetical protein